MGWGLILWAAIFHRRSRTDAEVPPQSRYDMPIEVRYTVVPLIIVSVLFDKFAHTVGVVGFQWNWRFNHVEDVDGDTGTGDAKADPDMGIVPNRYRDAFPSGAEGVFDVGVPGTRNPQTGDPGAHPVAAEGREGPLRALLACGLCSVPRRPGGMAGVQGRRQRFQ